MKDLKKGSLEVFVELLHISTVGYFSQLAHSS